MLMNAIALVAFVAGIIMLAILITGIADDSKARNWKPWHSIDSMLYAVAFVCVIVTALYAMMPNS
jgi:hypothetical protein